MLSHAESLNNSLGSDRQATSPLDPHRDARALVRLIQCSFCSYPLRTPLTLPCGNSLCRQCLPPSHFRDHITYPATLRRQQGIKCPFAECGEIHPVDDCSVNVVLLKVMEAVHEVVRNSKAHGESEKPVNPVGSVTMDEAMQIPPTTDSNGADTGEALSEKGHHHVADGPRLLATFDFASSGSLHYTSDVVYDESNGNEAEEAAAAAVFLSRLKELAYKDLECHVCYNLMLDPTTTPCGHTFCRKCLARILDHSPLCPVCRRDLFLPSSLARQPGNKYINKLLASLYPDVMAARAEQIAQDEMSAPEGLDTALFPCTLGFPDLRTYLHIFEPRYRLMIRRALEANGRFGMLAYNRYMEPQGELGRTQFMQYGTMLQIERYQMLPDGRSFIECKGVHRFRVLAHDIMDGYIVGRVEKLDDISLAEEEALEAEETRQEPDSTTESAVQLARMPTSELHEICWGFVERARGQSQRWFSNRLIEAYGEPPNDPKRLPYWLAAVLPLVDEEKYKVLPTTSIRQRLKIAAGWVQRIESQRWLRDAARASSSSSDEESTENTSEPPNNQPGSGDGSAPADNEGETHSDEFSAPSAPHDEA